MNLKLHCLVRVVLTLVVTSIFHSHHPQSQLPDSRQGVVVNLTNLILLAFLIVLILKGGLLQRILFNGNIKLWTLKDFKEHICRRCKCPNAMGEIFTEYKLSHQGYISLLNIPNIDWKKYPTMAIIQFTYRVPLVCCEDNGIMTQNTHIIIISSLHPGYLKILILIMRLKILSSYPELVITCSETTEHAGS